jgi:hypothetical protein
MIITPANVFSNYQTMDAQKSEQQNQQNQFLQAASDASLNRSMFARDILATSNATGTLLPFLQQGLQQGSLPFAFGGGFPGLQSQMAGQQADLSSLLHGLVARNQPIGDSLYLHGALGASGGTSLFAQGAPVSAAPLTLPATTLATLSSRIPSFMGSSQRGPPSSQEVQDALATLAAATGTPLQANTGPQPILEPEKPTPPGGHHPVVVYMECDEESLSDYQCLLRKQIELFEA